MPDASTCLERSNGGSTYTYLWVQQERMWQPRHRFQKSSFWSVYTETSETQPWSFQTKGLFTRQHFQPKMGIFVCVLPVCLHDNCVLGTENAQFWKLVSKCKCHRYRFRVNTQSGPDLHTGILGTCLCLLARGGGGGANTM